jgi:hypothetical protein
MALASLPSAAKRRRLEQLDGFRRRLPHMSQTALAAVCKDIQQHGLPDDFSERAQYEARNLLRGLTNEYGPIIRKAELVRVDDAKPVNVEFANVWAMLHHMLASGGELANIIHQRHVASPSSSRKPWMTC